MFVETNEQYHNGVMVNEHNGNISLIEGTQGHSGRTFIRWAKPQIGPNQYADKNIPQGIRLGSADVAVKNLTALLKLVKSCKSVKDLKS